MKLSVIGPLILGVGLLAAACGPAGSPPASGGATVAPAAQATQAPAAAAKPTAQAAAQPTAASQPTASAASAAPAAAGQPVKGGQLVIATQRDATTFDPTKSQDVYSGDILSLVSDTLFEVDDKGQVVGRLVEKTENPEPNVYVFTLKKGVKFQDGTDFNSDAVKFNL